MVLASRSRTMAVTGHSLHPAFCTALPDHGDHLEQVLEAFQHHFLAPALQAGKGQSQQGLERHSDPHLHVLHSYRTRYEQLQQV
jgi:hypothetical protein